MEKSRILYYPTYMRRFLTALAVSSALAGCAGTNPEINGLPEQGMSAVIIGGRFLLPTGETRKGTTYLNLEGEGGRQAEVYRLRLFPRQSLLYHVEPGVYRISPTRSIFGFHRKTMKVKIDGVSYQMPFPREILRKSSIDIKPKKIVALGVLEAKVSAALPGQHPLLRVRLDDSIDARRQLVQDVIHQMMDPAASLETRESAIAWSRALENSLMELVAESERSPTFKPAR